MKHFPLTTFLFFILAFLCLTLFTSSGLAFILGLALALTLGNPFLEQSKKWTPKLLSLAIVGLGAGMNLNVLAAVGMRGIGFTVIGILTAFVLGLGLGKFFKTPKTISLLITVGTAICGGSAIAAAAPVIRAKPHEISVSLGIVFLLNAVALIVFPFIGHFFSLTETQFGVWSALAIHDTSSVVGATMQYGPLALKIGTTVKLARALWIIPMAALIGLLWKQDEASIDSRGKMKIPWFILGFILMAAAVTYWPILKPIGHDIELLAKRIFVLTLFLIGTNLTLETIKKVGARPLIHGLGLWFLMASLSLIAILRGLIDLN